MLYLLHTTEMPIPRLFAVEEQIVYHMKILYLLQENKLLKMQINNGFF